MKKELKNQYELLVSFLGKTLGPCYEVVLHEIVEKEIKTIAIANGEISGRMVGSPAFEKTLNLFTNEIYKKKREILNYTSILKNGKKIRSSTMLIYDENNVVGMLCINFDDSQFHELNNNLLKIIHPDLFVQNYLSDVSYNVLMDELHSKNKTKSINNMHSLIENIFEEVRRNLSIPAERLTKTEKEAVVEALQERGLFHLKGSIPFVAKKLNSSPASIYRYLAKTK